MRNIEFEELKKSFWKVVNLCNGFNNDCWCRSIVTEQFDLDGDLSKQDDKVVIGSAVMSEEEAEYFVYLHNKQLDGYMDMKFND